MRSRHRVRRARAVALAGAPPFRIARTEAVALVGSPVCHPVFGARGPVTVFRAPKFTNDISKYEIRKMDCMDCHNRPSHRYVPPDFAVNQALAAVHQDLATSDELAPLVAA